MKPVGNVQPLIRMTRASESVAFERATGDPVLQRIDLHRIDVRQ
jgi:hypothetical protein